MLGAWANISQSQRALDVGTGTGLIALMLAQRNPEAIVEAVEINPAACMQARQNFEQSPYSSHLILHYTSLQEFAGQDNRRFDHVVCNPPFFENHYQSQDSDRNQARHTDSLSLVDLLQGARSLLHTQGQLSLIFPAAYCPDARFFSDAGFYSTRRTEVRSLATKPVFRILLELSLEASECVEEVLVIQNSTVRHDYTGEFLDLVRAFYLYV